MHGTAAQHVNVQMVDSLASIRAAVDDGAEALRQALALGETGGGLKQMAHERAVAGSDFGERCDVLARQDQQMRRRLRTNVGKRARQLILVHHLRWNLTGNNLAEQAVHVAHIPLRMIVPQSP
jgi:hypothetical protein